MIFVDDVPTVGFNYLDAGGEVSFNNTTVNANTYHWDFGDGSGSMSTEENPSYNYTAAGTYEVSLTATNNCQRCVGCLNSVAIVVLGIAVLVRK